MALIRVARLGRRARNRSTRDGIEISQRAVGRLIPRRRRPRSQSWRSFLDNHVRDLVSMDLLVVPTATFRILFVLVILSHERRRILHLGVTDSPTAAWTAQQVAEAFPWNEVPRYLIHDRDAIYPEEFRARVSRMGIAEVITAARSPWQNPYAERVIGSIRRELLDHVIVLNEAHLRRRLRAYKAYYHRSRTRLALCKDAPEPRVVEPPSAGGVHAVAEVGGLHHRYFRQAA
jgi:transposase InsO family protein